MNDGLKNIFQLLPICNLNFMALDFEYFQNLKPFFIGG